MIAFRSHTREKTPTTSLFDCLVDHALVQSLQWLLFLNDTLSQFVGIFLL